LTKGNQAFSVYLGPDNPQNREFLNELLADHGVKNFGYTQPMISDNVTAMLLSVVLPLGVIFVFWMFFLRQAQSGGNQALSFGRSRAKRLNDNVPKVTFEDVAGVDEAKQELQEVVEFLKNAKKFPGGENPQRRPAARPARMRQDHAGSRHRRRGGCAVLPYLRFRLCRNVRWRRRVPRPRPV
jgi:cell division protease FtsH